MIPGLYVDHDDVDAVVERGSFGTFEWAWGVVDLGNHWTGNRRMRRFLFDLAILNAAYLSGSTLASLINASRISLSLLLFISGKGRDLDTKVTLSVRALYRVPQSNLNLCFSE